MIRPCAVEDVPAVAGVILAADRQMDFTGRYRCGVNVPRIVRVLMNAIESPRADLSVVRLDGAVAGVCLVELVPFLWDDRALVAHEHLWHMHPEWPDARQKREWFIRMLDHMMAWVGSQGGARFNIGAPPGSPAAKLLARRGLINHENYFTGDASWQPQLQS
jgi:hypothetical protein